MFMAKKETQDRNRLSRSHLHHSGRRGVDHVYFVMPNQQYSQLQNMYLLRIVRIIFDTPRYVKIVRDIEGGKQRCLHNV
jgi:hypothetical protein